MVFLKGSVDLGDHDHHSADVDALHALYGRLHSSCPVGRSESYGGYYLLAGYDDVRTAAGDWETFTWAGGTRLPKAPFRIAAIEFDPPEHRFWRNLYREVLNLATYRVRGEDRFACGVAGRRVRRARAGRARLRAGRAASPCRAIPFCAVGVAATCTR